MNRTAPNRSDSSVDVDAQTADAIPLSESSISSYSSSDIISAFEDPFSEKNGSKLLRLCQFGYRSIPGFYEEPNRDCLMYNHDQNAFQMMVNSAFGSSRYGIGAAFEYARITREELKEGSTLEEALTKAREEFSGFQKENQNLAEEGDFGFTSSSIEVQENGSTTCRFIGNCPIWIVRNKRQRQKDESPIIYCRKDGHDLEVLNNQIQQVQSGYYSEAPYPRGLYGDITKYFASQLTDRPLSVSEKYLLVYETLKHFQERKDYSPKQVKNILLGRSLTDAFSMKNRREGRVRAVQFILKPGDSILIASPKAIPSPFRIQRGRLVLDLNALTYDKRVLDIMDSSSQAEVVVNSLTDYFSSKGAPADLTIGYMIFKGSNGRFT